jgi:starch synthase (maltosyl-transferring)
VGNELEAGAALLDARLQLGGNLRPDTEATLTSEVEHLRDPSLSPGARMAAALGAGVAEAFSGPDGATDLTKADPAPLWVDRPRASVGAWYEMFPRSEGGLCGVVRRVPELAANGFDVLYLPPIHPIGTTARKGPGNTLAASPGDPGSPWAIGNAEGGHTSIDPSLGTTTDFARLLQTLEDHGMELAMDYALQCSPDHPWVHEHPEWFHQRPDGSIAYAENPPKKYEDIVPMNFWPPHEADRAALWEACKGILVHWMDAGVRIFRVDNPHTKPLAFWDWLISEVRAERPDVILLAEAFTRPRMMAALAEVGFSQSYTYFTWRTEQYGEEGLRTYLEELAHGPLADFMRPNLWPNTPDILSGPLRFGPPAAFALRLVLAATMSPSYGVYSGYELYENEPASDTSEEYLHSEKYEIKHRDWARPGNLIPFIARVNWIRRRHVSLQRLRTIRFHDSDNPEVIAYSKTGDNAEDPLLVVVTLDPHAVQEATIRLDLRAIGAPADRPFEVIDELSGERFSWEGPAAYVRFEPWSRVAHILRVV